MIFKKQKAYILLKFKKTAYKRNTKEQIQLQFTKEETPQI